MRKRGCASGFALSDLVMPVAVLVLVLSAAGYVYGRRVRQDREIRTREVIADALGCQAEDILQESVRARTHVAAVTEERENITRFRARDVRVSAAYAARARALPRVQAAYDGYDSQCASILDSMP